MSTTYTRDITSQVDGVTTVFTVPLVYDADTLVVYLNGVQQVAGAPGSGDGDFEEIRPTNNSFQWNCPTPPHAGDTLQVQFEVGGAPFPFPVVMGSGQPPGSC